MVKADFITSSSNIFLSDFQVDSLFIDKQEVYDVLVHNLSMPVNETNAVLRSKVNVKEVCIH